MTAYSRGGVTGSEVVTAGLLGGNPAVICLRLHPRLFKRGDERQSVITPVFTPGFTQLTDMTCKAPWISVCVLENVWLFVCTSIYKAEFTSFRHILIIWFCLLLVYFFPFFLIVTLYFSFVYKQTCIYTKASRTSLSSHTHAHMMDICVPP